MNALKNTHVAAPVVTKELSLVENVEHLEKLLGEARIVAQRIVRQSKAQVKQNHSLKKAMASIKQIQTLDIAL